jgi:hypothetical protein
LCLDTYALFVWLISHQPTLLFSQNKPATSNQPAVLFFQNKSAPAISHQPNEQADSSMNIYRKVKTTYITEGIGSILEKEEGAILNS